MQFAQTWQSPPAEGTNNDKEQNTEEGCLNKNLRQQKITGGEVALKIPNDQF